MWGTERKCPLTLWLLSLLTVRIIVIQLSFGGKIINIQGNLYALSFRVLKDLLRSLKAESSWNELLDSEKYIFRS